MAKTKKVSIQDIARRAGVSKSTVSRVLNRATAVAPDKESAVLEAVSDLNYQPNIFARGLAGGQSMTIGVLTQNVGSPFYDAIMAGVISALEGSRYWPIFADGRWQERVEEKALQTLMSRHVDGLILVGGTLSVQALHTINEQSPLLVVARQIPEFAERCLFIDNFEAAYQATHYLIELGHRRIAHISGMENHQDASQRREGYAQALADAGIELNPNLIVEGTFRQQSGVLAVETLLAQRQTFSAIFAANDQMAMGARLALFRRGIRVPDDVSLIGFDDQSGAAFMTPPLTTVRQPATEMGEAAARILLHLLKNEPYEIPRFPTQLIIRESTSALR